MAAVSGIRALEVVEGFVESPTVIATATRALLATLSARAGKTIRNRQTFAFDAGGHQAHGGHKWAKLSPSTIAIKARMGVANPSAPLIRTGAMQLSQKCRVELFITRRGGVGFRIVAWNDMPYSRHHQTGFFNVWTNTFVPRRKVVDITKQDLKYVRDLIATRIIGVSRADTHGAAKKAAMKRGATVALPGGLGKRVIKSALLKIGR